MTIVKFDEVVNGKPLQYNLTPFLKRQLDTVRKNITERDMDRLWIVDGHEGCLEAGTLIKTNKGSFTIEKLYLKQRRNIRLQTYNFKLKKVEEGKFGVVKTGKKEVYSIEMTGGRIVHATGDHTFFIKNKIKVFETPLSQIKKGDKVVCDSGTILVKSIKKIGLKKTYDIKVYPNHNFYLANGILTHNCGKSTFAFQMAKYVDPNFTIDDIYMTGLQLKKGIEKPGGSKVKVFDEAYVGLSSRGSMSKINKMLIDMCVQMRQRNLFVIMVIPSFFFLDRYIKDHRANCLVHIYFTRDGTYRRIFSVLNRDFILKLKLNGQKNLDYAKTLSMMSDECKGLFGKTYTIDKIAYLKKKDDALKGAQDDDVDKGIHERNQLIFFMYKELKISPEKLKLRLEKIGFKLSARQIRRIIDDYKKQEKEEKINE